MKQLDSYQLKERLIALKFLQSTSKDKIKIKNEIKYIENLLMAERNSEERN